MNPGIAVSDASPPIALNQIERLDLLRSQFSRIVVPMAVVREVAPSVGMLPGWIRRHYAPPSPGGVSHLHDGEREAIALAIELAADILVIDDLPGHRAATKLGLRVIGSLELLVRAKRMGLIGEVRPIMDALIAGGLFVGDLTYREILVLAGEGDS